MELKYNLMEGNDAVSRTILMMKYDLTKTLTENLISEQPESIMDRRGNAILRGQGVRSQKDYEFMEKFLDDANMYKFSKQLYNYLASLDSHEWLSLIEVTSGVLGMIPSPLSPLLLGISFVAGVSDAALYYSEGDKYMGSLMLILAIVPGSELVKIMKGSKVFQKRSIKGSMDLIKKFKSGGKLTKTQTDDLSKLGYDIAKNSPNLKPAVSRQISKRLISGLSKKSAKYLINLLLVLKKLGVIKLSEIILKVGGTIYTFDKLYLYVFRDSIFADKKDLDNRTKNELRYLVNNLLKYDKEVNEYLLMISEKGLERAINRDVDFYGIDVSERPDTFMNKLFDEFEKESKSKSKINSPSSLISPSLPEVLSGKKVIKKGQKGKSVEEIQKMLYSVGYDDYLSMGGDLVIWNDGVYGDSTELAVIAFQGDEGLDDVDGIVGSETLNKLNAKYSEKKNE